MGFPASHVWWNRKVIKFIMATYSVLTWNTLKPPRCNVGKRLGLLNLRANLWSFPQCDECDFVRWNVLFWGMVNGWWVWALKKMISQNQPDFPSKDLHVRRLCVGYTRGYAPKYGFIWYGASSLLYRYLKWPLNMCLVYCAMSKAHSDPLNATLRQRLCWNIQAVHDVNQLLVRKHDR